MHNAVKSNGVFSQQMNVASVLQGTSNENLLDCSNRMASWMCPVSKYVFASGPAQNSKLSNYNSNYSSDGFTNFFDSSEAFIICCLFRQSKYQIPPLKILSNMLQSNDIGHSAHLITKSIRNLLSFHIYFRFFPVSLSLLPVFYHHLLLDSTYRVNRIEWNEWATNAIIASLISTNSQRFVQIYIRKFQFNWFRYQF